MPGALRRLPLIFAPWWGVRRVSGLPTAGRASWRVARRVADHQTKIGAGGSGDTPAERHDAKISGTSTGRLPLIFARGA